VCKAGAESFRRGDAVKSSESTGYIPTSWYTPQRKELDRLALAMVVLKVVAYVVKNTPKQ